MIDFLRQLFNRVFVGDISYHNGSPRIIFYIVDLDRIGRAFIELLESIVLVVVHIVVLTLLIGVHVVADWVDINGASVTLLKGLNRPNLGIYRRIKLL